MRIIISFTLLIIFSLTFLESQDISTETAILPQIITIPKAGTNFMKALVEELNLPIKVNHLILDCPEQRKYSETREVAGLAGLAFPSSVFKIKTVLVIRDLKDVMVSATWHLCRTHHHFLNYLKATGESSSYIDDLPQAQLLKIIQLKEITSPHMHITRYACKLILELIRKKRDSVFIIKFEDFIGLESGGCLCNSKRYKLLIEMFSFLGYEISYQEMEQAVNNIFGKRGCTFNPVIRKVGRWESTFNYQHKLAFKENGWDDLNISLGYDSISVYK